MTLDSHAEARLVELIDDARAFPWFASAGEPAPDGRVARDLSDAWDGYRDGWNARSIDFWRERTEALERLARLELGDAAIDHVFGRVAAAIGEPVWKGLERYLEREQRADPSFDVDGRQGAIAIDLLEQVKQDVAWAAIEKVLGRRGLHTELMGFYRVGRRLFGWDGGLPPGGTPVVL